MSTKPETRSLTNARGLLLRTTIAEVRLSALLHEGCTHETPETSAAVQDIRLRVYVALKAREEAAEAYVALLDAASIRGAA